MDCATWSARFLLNNHIGLTPRLATIRYSFTGRKLALPLRARQARDSRKSIAVTFLQDDGGHACRPLELDAASAFFMQIQNDSGLPQRQLMGSVGASLPT